MQPRLRVSPSPRLRVLALACTLALPFASHLQAQAPSPASGTAAALPPPPKKIPGLGLTLSDVDRAELTAGVAALRVEIDALAKSLASEPKLLALLPDVEIFHKAVAWSLEDDTFFATKEVAFAKHLLTEGRERAAQLRDKKAPWLETRGLIVRGYRSRIDQSVQPYGLVVSAELDLTKPTPLMVWLLGRSEKRTELAFLAEREGGPAQLTPKGTMTLVPYGRFCNATKFAGEVDVMEALDAVIRQYPLDPHRIAVAGFSMGGGSTWHLATHYAGLWCAASPGAGFAETPIFTKANGPGKEIRPAWEQLLWRQYEATGISRNLFNVPTLAYAGEIDGQKEASDLMEAAMAKEGLKLERFIGPQTAHKYHDGTKAELTKRLEELIAKGRDAIPAELRYATYTVRYPGEGWARITGMEKQWELATVQATYDPAKGAAITTSNVTHLDLLNKAVSTALVIDGQKVSTSAPGYYVSFRKQGGQWTDAPDTAQTARKAPGLSGPVDDAFMDAFVFVRPTGKTLNPELATWVESELTTARHLWRDVYRGEAPVITDAALTEADITNKNLILWGDPTSNKMLTKLLATGKLPLTWDGKNLTVHGKTYSSATHAPILIFPNPLNPKRYVVLNSGLDFRADGYGNNALQTPKLPDWAVVDLRTAPGPRWPGKIVDAGFFNEEWK